MCIAAYLAIGGGLGVSLSTAAHLRTALLWVCWSVLALLAVRMLLRFRTRAVAAARQVFRSAQPNTRRSPAQSAAV
jgi:cytochrome c-type biogenesis protein CcmH/NrfF